MKIKVKSLLLIIISLMLIVTACTASSDTINIDDQLSLGQKYLNELDYENAVLAFQKIIEVDPKNIQAYLGLAEAYEKIGKNEEAIIALEKVIEVKPENEEAYIRISDIYVKNGETENAIKFLTESLNKNNNEAIRQKLEKVKSESNNVSGNNSGSENGSIDENSENGTNNVDGSINSVSEGNGSGNNSGNKEFEFNTSIDLSSGFNVEIINDREAIFYLRDDNLQSSYIVGEYYIDGELILEHLWLISFEHGTNSYQVGTVSYIEDLNSVIQVGITDMYHDLSIQDPNDVNHHDYIAEVGFELKDNVLAYKVIVPDDVDFNFKEVDSYNIEIIHDNGADLWDSYNSSYTKDNNGNLIVVN